MLFWAGRRRAQRQQQTPRQIEGVARAPDNTTETKARRGAQGSGTDKVLDHMLPAGLVLLRYLVSLYHPTRHAPAVAQPRTNALDKSWSQERTECRIRSLGCLFFPCSSPPFFARDARHFCIQQQIPNHKPMMLTICRSR